MNDTVARYLVLGWEGPACEFIEDFSNSDSSPRFGLEQQRSVLG